MTPIQNIKTGNIYTLVNDADKTPVFIRAKVKAIAFPNIDMVRVQLLDCNHKSIGERVCHPSRLFETIESAAEYVRANRTTPHQT